MTLLNVNMLRITKISISPEAQLAAQIAAARDRFGQPGLGVSALVASVALRSPAAARLCPGNPNPRLNPMPIPRPAGVACWCAADIVLPPSSPPLERAEVFESEGPDQLLLPFHRLPLPPVEVALGTDTTNTWPGAR